MIKNYFTKMEIILFAASICFVSAFFFIFDRENYLSLFASLLGVTSLIFSAKGNPAGQLLMIIFSIVYGIISYGFSYYGEMITYLGMTLPMSVFAFVSWLKNPYKDNKSEVRVNRLSKKEYVLMLGLTLLVTLLFYFILRSFETANLIPGTVSVTTSFAAVYLSFRRSPCFALAYAANDVILIILWILASIEDPTYISVTACFAVFFVNDIYGFISWCKMEKKQKAAE